MTNRGILLQLLMQELDVDPHLRMFGDRLVLQKGVYLLQALGIPTDFSYNWYLRGPYSPALTEAAFEEVVKPLARGDRTWEGYSLAPHAADKVKKLLAMVENCHDAGLSRDAWLELIASMHFYRHRMYFPPQDRAQREDPTWLYERLPTAKKNSFSTPQARLAAMVLCEAGLWQG